MEKRATELLKKFLQLYFDEGMDQKKTAELACEVADYFMDLAKYNSEMMRILKTFGLSERG